MRRIGDQNKGVSGSMKRILWFAALAFCLSVPSLVLAQEGTEYNHAEVGAFVDYENFARTSPHINFLGLGGRAAFNAGRYAQIEAEMNYDFKRNFTNEISNGISTTFVTTRLRPLHAMFGPKFNTTVGGARAFFTFKVGFVNFSATNQNAPAGFTTAVGGITTGNTRPAIYPGVGLEGFWGPFGLRFDVGDDIYFDNGARNNLKMSFGPAIRF